MEIKSKDFLLIFTAILYVELVFKFILFKDVLSFSTINIFFFTLAISSITYFATTLFNKTINRIMLLIIIFLICFISFAQVLYFKIYDSIISFYSIKQAGNIMEFGSVALDLIVNNILILIIMFAPFTIAFVFIRKFSFNSINVGSKLFVAIVTLVIYILGIQMMQINKRDLYSAYNLYYNEHAPIMMADKLGVLTTMRIDFIRATFGFNKTSDDYSNAKKEEVVPETNYNANTLDIDFAALINSEKDETIKGVHTYFGNTEPTYQNEFTGMFKGKNLIVILAEALDPIAIDKAITPTLYKLVNEGFKFNNFYTPLFPVSTSDGEYLQQISLLPKEGIWSLMESSKNMFPFTVARLMMNDGYKTSAYHGHTGTYYNRYLSVPNLGYETFKACKMGLNINCKSWPESDVEVIDATVPEYINSDRFMTYYISISGHLNYTRTGNAMVRKNWDSVSNLPYSDLVKGYMSAQKELDSALARLIVQLDSAGKLEDTVIAISPDHYPYGLSLDQINEKSAYVRDDVFEKHRSTFIIWNSDMKPFEVDTLAGNIDVLPTLANLFGLKYDSRLLMGRDILSKHESIVMYSNRSWITEKGRYNAITKVYEGITVTDEYINRINQIIYDRFNVSRAILERDYYRYLKY